MKERRLIQQDWGNLYFCVDVTKMDFLPRITASAIKHAFIFNMGFLMFSLNLTIWEKPMRDFLREHRDDTL